MSRHLISKIDTMISAHSNDDISKFLNNKLNESRDEDMFIDRGDKELVSIIRKLNTMVSFSDDLNSITFMNGVIQICIAGLSSRDTGFRDSIKVWILSYLKSLKFDLEDDEE